MFILDLTLDEHLINQCKNGLKYRNLDKKKVYVERLDMELDIITRMGFSNYFLIVSDFIKWSKNRKIPIGPGRGSGSGSLVSYTLGITNINPIKYKLLFERFLNADRVTMPDFDIDFCMVERDDVLGYMQKRYGHKAVGQIVTFSTMNAKSSVRDIGRALGYSYSFVDRIAKLIPFKIGTTLTESLKNISKFKELYKKNSEMKLLVDYGIRLEGIVKNVGRHAGGLVISPTKLIDFTPVFFEKNSTYPITQLDKNDAESIGLVKFDFLSLKTLSIIKWAYLSAKTFSKKKLKKFNIYNVPLYDRKTFNVLSTGNTTGIFQFESFGVKKLMSHLEPDKFSHVVDMGALYRPGPLKSGMVANFIKRRHGSVFIRYVHKYLEPILACTYGVLIYQEQVMEIAQFLSGYTLGEADLLRRAMGKKDLKEMHQHKLIFLERITTYNISKLIAGDIFDLMHKFSGYGFNRSHSTAYGIISYQTAYLKGNFTAYFLAATLSADSFNNNKIKHLLYDCKINNDIRVYAPCINKSLFNFSVYKKRHILYGLGAIKAIAKDIVINVLDERKKGYFKSLYDFCLRIDMQNITAKTLEVLIYSGCFDNINKDRFSLIQSVKRIMKMSRQVKAGWDKGQLNLFLFDNINFKKIAIDKKKFDSNMDKKYYESIQLYHEKQNLCSYISDHPISKYINKIGSFITSDVKYLFIKEEPVNNVIAMLTYIKPFFNEKSEMILIAKMEDHKYDIEVIILPALYKKIRYTLSRNVAYFIKGKQEINFANNKIKIHAEKIRSLNNIFWDRIRYIKIIMLKNNMNSHNIRNLFSVLKKNRGGICPIIIEVQYNDNMKLIKCLKPKWNIEISYNFSKDLKSLLEYKSIKYIYK